MRRPAHAAFAFTHRRIEGRTLMLGYALRGGPDPDIAFEEHIGTPVELPAPDPGDPAVDVLLDAVHRAFGVSYYKAAVPPRVEAEPVGPAEAALWDTLYGEGLGEFWFRNQLDPAQRGAFPVGPPRPAVSIAQPATERVLVLAGGGKDSAVAAEVVRAAGVEADAYSLGSAPWLGRSAAAMGLRHLRSSRRLDPALLALNAAGAYNGHVPISAAIAALSTLVAYVGGYSAVLAANERAADEGNTRWRGIEVNHQWSKSLRFEAAWAEFCAARAPGAPLWRSLLRPLGELAITTAFARHPRYFDHITSCNANFRQSPGAEPSRWCGRCPKCVFVALCLSPALSEADTARIFGQDVLAHRENEALLAALVGQSGMKPFECVGTPEESRLALSRLARQGRLRGMAADFWRDHPEVAAPADDAAWTEAQRPEGPHLLPPVWEERLHAYLRAAPR